MDAEGASTYRGGRNGQEAIARRCGLCGRVCGCLSEWGARGEVKGPPGQVDNTNTTGALDHANSVCAASGLNDFAPGEGQNVSQVQTAADSWKYYGLSKGAPGTLGLCKGGTTELLAPRCRGRGHAEGCRPAFSAPGDALARSSRLQLACYAILVHAGEVRDSRRPSLRQRPEEET
jgi:hypothetical protein